MGIHIYPYLPIFTAPDEHRGDSGKALQSIGHVRIQIFPGLPGIHIGGIAQHHHRHGLTIELAHQRTFRIFRKIFLFPTHPLPHLRHRFIEVRSPLELSHHVASPFRRGGTNAPKPGDPPQSPFQGFRDIFLHLPGAGVRIGGVNGDPGSLQGRKQVHRNISQSHHAEKEYQKGSHGGSYGTEYPGGDKVHISFRKGVI